MTRSAAGASPAPSGRAPIALGKAVSVPEHVLSERALIGQCPALVARTDARLAVLCAMLVMAVPGAAWAEPDAPPLSIVSAGDAVEVGADLTVGPLALANSGTAPAAQAQVQFRLLFSSPSPLFSFSQDQPDPGCERPTIPPRSC